MILIAEGDEERCRNLAQSVRELGASDVTQVHSLAAAMEQLGHQAVDILICGERLLDQPGAVLLDAVRTASPATRALLIPDDDERDGGGSGPFGRRTQTATRALLELALESVATQEGFRCRVPDLALPDILQMYHQLRRSVTVLVSGPIAGRIRLEQGELVHAESGDQLGAPALERLLATDSGLVRTELSAFDGIRTISAPFHRVLLDAVHQLDARRQGPVAERLCDLGEAELDAQLRFEHLPDPLPDATSFARMEAQPRTRPRRREMLLLAAAVLAGSTLVAVLAVQLGARDERTLEDNAAQVPEAPPLPATAIGSLQAAEIQETNSTRASAERASSNVALLISSVPSGASVTEGGKLLGKTPLTVAWERSDTGRAPRRFELSLKGYQPYALTQPTPSADVSFTAALSAITPSAPASSPRSKPAAIATERQPPAGRAPALEIRLQR